jgi:hypothetical protein
MGERKGTQKPYMKPEIHQVKLVLDEAVLQACKVSKGASGPNPGEHCRNPKPRCRNSVGS